MLICYVVATFSSSHRKVKNFLFRIFMRIQGDKASRALPSRIRPPGGDNPINLQNVVNAALAIGDTDTFLVEHKYAYANKH